MKKQLFMVSLTSVALALPAWAQQSTSAVPSQTQATSAREPLTAPVPKDFWDGEEPNVANLVTHPFANKAYVQRQTRPIHDRLNELDQLTSENSRKIKDVDTRAQHGMQLASEKSNLADQHATDAMNRAELAKTDAMNASMRVAAAEKMVGRLDQYKGSTQTEIRFRPGQSVLSKHAKDALHAMANPLKTQTGYLIEIRGVAPGRGRVATTNAKKMSNSVVRYLVQTQQIPLYRISVLNMSSSKATKSRRAHAGRVEISVLQNGTVDTAQR